MINTYPQQPLILRKDIISAFRINTVALQRYTDERKKLSDFGRMRLIVKRVRQCNVQRV